ncbi:MAG: SsrA-binding protein SmpB [bacterium]|jgi:SsrA-binding protein
MSEQIIIKNKKAFFEYHILDKYVAGIQLLGTEIKSIRAGKANLNDGYCSFIGEELFAFNIHISEYSMGSFYNHVPKRNRKLLLNKKELKKIKIKSQDKGLTIIPLQIFFNERGFAKLEIAVAQGKKIHDKRDTMKERDSKKELNRLNKS